MTEGKEKERASGERNSGEKEMFSLICATAVPHLFYASSQSVYIFFSLFFKCFFQSNHIIITCLQTLL